MSQTLKQHLAAVNKWRSQFNPLRGLTIQRAVALLEDGERGAHADLQWTFRHIEKRHPVLRALKARRLAAIGKLDWRIKTNAETGMRNAELAERQAAFLRECYERIDNLRAAIRFLALAEFRGFAHLERQRVEMVSGQPSAVSPEKPSATNHLELVEQWFWCRDGLYAPWQYNAEAASGRVTGQPADPTTLLIREVEDPLNEIALIQFTRAGLCNKDWDAFIEIYGLPRPAVIMPPNVPPDKEAEYRDAAASIADGQSGALPAGSDVKYPTEARGTQPFLERLKRLDEELVLAGTGGNLTMLAESGTGTLAGNAQADVFADIAAAEALAISEVFQTQFDALLLAEKFPGQPVLAYFELAAPDQEDISEIIDHAVKLAQAGYQLDAAELEERTGYKLASETPVRRDSGFNPETDPVILRRLAWEKIQAEKAAEDAGTPIANRSWWGRLWDVITNTAEWITTKDGRRINLAWFKDKEPDLPGKSDVTSSAKSGRMKGQNERQKQHPSGDRSEGLGEESGGNGRTLSRRIAEETADDGGGVRGSGRAADERSLSESYSLTNADQDAIARIRESNPELVRDPAPDLPDQGGAEHVVQFPGDGTATKFSTGFGHVILGTGEYPPARAQEYLDRVGLLNETFGLGIRVDGVSEYKGKFGIATSMPFIQSGGQHPTDMQVARVLGKFGFQQTGYNEVFYNPKTRVLIHDARPDNFILTKSGAVVPVDLGMQRVKPGGKIEKWIKAGGGFDHIANRATGQGRLMAALTGGPRA